MFPMKHLILGWQSIIYLKIRMPSKDTKNPHERK